MKILLLRKCIIFILIVVLLSSLIILHLAHISEQESGEILDIQIFPENECECNESTKLKKKESFFKEQYKNKKLVALTFDDGPSEYTSKLIDELKKRDVVVTFFVLGSEIEKYPETLQFAYDTGNEIAIHSYEHKLFTKLSKEEIEEQISKTKNIIFDITTKNPELVRVPYGALNKETKQVLEEFKLTSVLWNVDSLDWKLKNANKIYEYVMKKFQGNDIILMHDNFKTSIEAATLIIDKLQNECYTFVTVSEFLKIKEEVNK